MDDDLDDFDFDDLEADDFDDDEYEGVEALTAAERNPSMSQGLRW